MFVRTMHLRIHISVHHAGDLIQDLP